MKKGLAIYPAKEIHSSIFSIFFFSLSGYFLKNLVSARDRHLKVIYIHGRLVEVNKFGEHFLYIHGSSLEDPNLFKEAVTYDIQDDQADYSHHKRLIAVLQQ